ncbi:hypothetical protein [Nocardia transvalensis]|uniref:hypothetical protein n=1 Tax=Nocardia transvalensis TaxID=37333 RepID=UPI001894795D|nr:hypothetical protein [Nocardia transvalensis]MBF6333025.1 hypothetical protein [Nocardia transvalensis]
MHSLFLVRAGQTVTGEMRFEEPGLPPPCAVQMIVHELDDLGELGSAGTTVSECDGRWAVIAWDVPGDSQRLQKYFIIC